MRCPWGVALACTVATIACGGSGTGSGGATTAKKTDVSISLVTYTTTYPNGFELITDEDHRSPTVAVNLSYRVGSRDDPPGRAGLAHFVEHLMFRGSRHVAPGEFSERVLGAGGRRNAHTFFDRTWYVERLPSQALELVLWLESDRLLANLETIDETALATERDVVKNEWRQRGDDLPAGDVFAATQAALFPEGHPYHHLTIGSPEDLDRVTLDDVKAFARRYYVPSNATLVLVGDFDRDAVVKRVGKWFGSLPKLPAPTRVNPANVPLPRLHGVTRLDVEADVDHPEVLVSWPGPRLFGEDDAAMDEYSWWLGAVLHSWLVSDDELARSVGAYRIKGELGSNDTIEFTLADGTSEGRVTDAIDKLGELRMDARSVDGARFIAVADLVFHLESFDSRADEYGLFRQSAGRALFAPTLVGRYDAVRAQGVREIKGTWFPSDARVVTVVHPVKGAPIAGRLVSTR